MKDRTITYAQNKEDILLSAYFPDVKAGFYVDIGASHPVVSSVTKLFYENGWRGINIEPSPKYYKLLQADRPRDINLNIGIADKPGQLEFREYQSFYGLSTFSSDMKQAYERDEADKAGPYIDYKVVVKTLADVFTEQKVDHIHFLKVDIEGFEYQALTGNDWKKYRPEVICIESNHIAKDWRPILESNSYKKHFFDGLNDYYVASESWHRAEQFSYENTILLGRPIIPLLWHQELGALRLRSELDLRTATNKQKELEREITLLKAQIQQDNRIRNLTKTLARNADNALTAHIEKLNKPISRKTRKRVPVFEPPADKSKLLAAVRLYDLENSYSRAGDISLPHNYAYKTLDFTHRGVRKAGWTTAKVGYHAIKKMKGRMRG